MRAVIGFHNSFFTVDAGVIKGLQFQLMYWSRCFGHVQGIGVEIFVCRLMVAVFRFCSP